ncbi:MAG: DNA-methyltransferase [Actinomycetota bacterium]
MDRVPRNTILVGDARELLQELPKSSIDCVITSPPYFRQRDFGSGSGQIGLERSVDAWVESLRGIFGALARVLKQTGAVWLNLADSYSRTRRDGAPNKGLLLAPERLLLALAADGWIVRNKVVWAKTNPMPSGITDRLETTYEVVYLLVRSTRGYFFDLDAIRPSATVRGIEGLGANPGDVWRLGTAGFRGHPATFPRKLVERPLTATCPAKLCISCGAPWRTGTTTRRLGNVIRFERDPFIRRHPVRYDVVRTHPRLLPGCRCLAPTAPGIVLDPFIGAGTVGLVAAEHGRDWLGIEVNRSFAQMAEQRLLEAAA